jgi:hypothetical protein
LVEWDDLALSLNIKCLSGFTHFVIVSEPYHGLLLRLALRHLGRTLRRRQIINLLVGAPLPVEVIPERGSDRHITLLTSWDEDDMQLNTRRSDVTDDLVWRACVGLRLRV